MRFAEGDGGAFRFGNRRGPQLDCGEGRARGCSV